MSRSRWMVAALLCGAAITAYLLTEGSDASARDSATKGIPLPAVAESLAPRVGVLAAPRPGARRVAVMRAFRFDFRPTVFLVTGRSAGERRGSWLRVEVPGRPNGRRGWVRESSLRLLRPAAPPSILIDRSRRKLWLERGGRTVLSAPVAVGTPAAPTPTGSFYVTAAFSPSDDFLGPWAFETSAYARISDWPRGGIVGLHGTSEPGSIGTRASHGCIRTYNRVILRLKRLVRPGTPLVIRP